MALVAAYSGMGLILATETILEAILIVLNLPKRFQYFSSEMLSSVHMFPPPAKGTGRGRASKEVRGFFCLLNALYNYFLI